MWFIESLLTAEKENIISFLSWGLPIAATAFFAHWQYKKTKTIARNESLNQCIKQFREQLAKVEDLFFELWLSESLPEDQKKLLKIAREIKELTTISTEVKKLGGPAYPSYAIMNLRKSSTYDKMIHDKPLDTRHYQVHHFQLTTSFLKSLYERNVP